MKGTQNGVGKRPAPKRVELRTETARAERSTRLCVRLPPAAAAKLERLAKARKVKRVTVLCDLIDGAGK